MSTVTNPSRISKDILTRDDAKEKNERPVPPLNEVKLETRLNIKDLESLQDAFMAEGDGYDNRLSLTRDQFCEALSLILTKGTKKEEELPDPYTVSSGRPIFKAIFFCHQDGNIPYEDLFDKIDVTKEGVVDWDKFASHMLLEFYEKDDRVKSTQVPQWKDLKNLTSPHKEVIQSISTLSGNRYIAISKEGCVSMWGQDLKLQRSLKTGTDTCRARDLWVTNFIPLHNINKIALSFTSKEIAVYDLSTKLEFNCQYKIQGLEHTPLCLDYWFNPENANEAILSWGDTSGCVNAIYFYSANIALFERPPAPAGEKQEPCLSVQLKDIIKKKYKNSQYMKHDGHTEWVRHVKYSPHLECFMSCATTWNNSLVIGWLEKHATSQNMKTTTFQIVQGVNAFDYQEQLNLIATAGVNHHVCLWNPYVVSKPNGVLRGHMASVVQVQFNRLRGQLISFSKDKVLRIWDVQLQVCIQRLAGMFPKGPEVMSILYYDERYNRLFITFNYQLTVMEMKPEIKDRILSHDKPVLAAFYNSTYNQVVSAGQNGTLTMWMMDTGQKVKTFHKLHGTAEMTALCQDISETRIYSGSTDGTVKIWDFNGHCYHTLHCGQDGQPADVGQILSLKRSIVVVGWTKYITVFRNQNMRDSVFHIEPSDWKGGQEHVDDILTMAFSGPNILASGSYDGEIILWNNNSEQASHHLTQCARVREKSKIFLTASTRENTKVTEGGFDSHSFKQTRPRTRPKSRTASRISLGGNDDTNEYGFAVTRLVFLEARKTEAPPGAANLVSCGGNGWVRFWNSSAHLLMAEFVAHTQVGSIIMAVDKVHNTWLVTGDVDGLIKVWNISEYALEAAEGGPITTLPPLQVQIQSHSDMISSLEMCTRNDRPLILSASSDCSIQLWDVYGNKIGIFGQESHWKIEVYDPKAEEEEQLREAHSSGNKALGEDDMDSIADDIQLDDNEEAAAIEPEEESHWEPDDRATEDPSNYRINVWDKTNLGRDYQELRVKKRERRQPNRIDDLAYLHWEKTGKAPAGPFSALETPELSEVGTLTKPDFMINPHKYFSGRLFSEDNNARLPALAERLNAAYDEKTLFPKYILDFETKMKQFHAKSLNDQQVRAGRGFMKAVTGQSSTVLSRLLGESETAIRGPSTIGGPSRNSPAHTRRSGVLIKPQKLKPVSVRSSAMSMKSSSYGTD